MKRGITFVFLFSVIILSSSFFVSTEQMDKELPGYGIIGADYELNSVEVVNGWNLVRGLPTPDWIKGGEVLPENIKGIYALNPFNQDYVRFYPEPEQSKIADTNFAWTSYLEQGAFWVYVDYPEGSTGQLEYETLKLTTLNKTWIFSGYNFLGIKPEMIGKKVSDFKGDCDIQEFYVFEPTTQEWVDISQGDIQDKFLGSGLAIKVSNDCSFSIEHTLPPFPSNNSSTLVSKYFSDDSEAILIAKGEKTVLLPSDDTFASRGIEWRILNGLRLAGYEPWAMPYGEIVDAAKIKQYDKEIGEAETLIYEKASKFPFYEDISKENFKENLPKEFGAYRLVSLFDLLNSGEIQYQKYTKECLFATLYPKNPMFINRGTNGSSPREDNVYVLPFIIQQGSLYGFNEQAHNWNVDEDLYPETAVPATSPLVDGGLHEWIHELDSNEGRGNKDDSYDRETYCGPHFMDFNYEDSTSPFNLDRNVENGLGNENFVSQYAGYNGKEQPYAPYFPVEDAAESVTAYILVPEYFRERMKNSEILEEKYNYIKDNIFGGVEFENPNLEEKSNFEFPNHVSDFYEINNINKFQVGEIKVK